MMTPFFAAILLIGGFPSITVLFLAIITVFAGYTAVYSLNDIIGKKNDKKKLNRNAGNEDSPDLDSVLVRHPLAQDLLSIKSAVVWAVLWGVVAFIGAYLLNPVCAFIFIVGCLLEAVYCFMLTISWMRVFVSGIVKTLGSVAAVFAVNPDPPGMYVLSLFLFLFFWELGGQNIPNDYTDINEDNLINARTLPLRFGSKTTGRIIMVSLVIAVFSVFVTFKLSGTTFEMLPYMILLTGSLVLLIWPAFYLLKTNRPEDALRLFNKASYYPAFLLAVVLFGII
ncbi:MAG: UbiA family prenyltransferase [Desulfobacterales bacterium]|nr:UbiA family prenyltransferase [Desulfobacterales bacterium]